MEKEVLETLFLDNEEDIRCDDYIDFINNWDKYVDDEENLYRLREVPVDVYIDILIRLNKIIKYYEKNMTKRRAKEDGKVS